MSLKIFWFKFISVLIRQFHNYKVLFINEFRFFSVIRKNNICRKECILFLKFCDLNIDEFTDINGNLFIKVYGMYEVYTVIYYNKKRAYVQAMLV